MEKIFNQKNNVLYNNKKYQTNNFAINKNGDLILEITEFSKYNELTSSRLFYGLTKDGKYFFLINFLILRKWI